MLGEMLLTLRSRRVLVCIAIAIAGAAAVLLLAPPEQRLLGIILLGAALGMVVVTSGLAIALAQSAGAFSGRDIAIRLGQLASQIQLGDINVARLAARVEQLGGGSGGPLSQVIDTITIRLNERAALLEQLHQEVRALAVRVALAEDQLLAQAVNVEQAVRRQASKPAE